MTVAVEVRDPSVEGRRQLRFERQGHGLEAVTAVEKQRVLVGVGHQAHRRSECRTEQLETR